MLMAAGDLGPVAALPLAGTATLDGAELDPREPTTLYVAERRVRADFEPEIMTAPPGTTTNGLTIVTEGEGQPATRTLERDLPAESRADRRRREKQEAAAAAATVAAASSGGDLPVEVLQADSARPPRRKWPWVVAAVVLVAVLAGGAAAAYVASRPETTVLTSYAGRPAAEVQSELEARGLVVTVQQESSETVAEGLVIGQDPPADTRLTEGDGVTLVVSSGQPPVTLPDVGGNGIDQATQILAGIGIQVGDVTRSYDENIEKDIVLGYAEGTPTVVPKTSTVGLRVSAGPAPRQIPANLSGGTKEAVTAQLQGLGLKVAYSEAYSPTIAQGLVIQTDPPAGTTVARDSTVTVQVSLGKEPVTIPGSIVGKSVAQATTILEGLGLSVSGVQGNPSKPVTGANPAVGSQVKPGSSVTLVTN
jgi:beta-lactam-binding protein with PASTA domain